jgi:hypothetical protein
MDTVKVTSTDSSRTVDADVVYRSDKKLIVIPENTTVCLVLHRESVKKPYVGRIGAMEFTSLG